VVSRLQSLGGRVVECLCGALQLRVQKTLGLTSTHYLLDFGLLRDGYVLREGVVGDEAELEAIWVVDASMAEPTTVLTDMFEVDMFPGVAEGKAAAAPSPRAP
jgi:hypothetical protein